MTKKSWTILTWVFVGLLFVASIVAAVALTLAAHTPSAPSNSTPQPIPATTDCRTSTMTYTGYQCNPITGQWESIPATSTPPVTLPPTATPTNPSAQPPAGPSINSALTINEFARMWSAHPVSEGPGPLMEELNSYFDNGGWQFGGQYSGQNGWDVPAGSVVWTDLLDQSNQVYYVGTTNPVNTTNDFVRLRCQGNWCVFYAYAAVRLPTPGRYLITDPWLNPANDLAGWLH